MTAPTVADWQTLKAYPNRSLFRDRTGHVCELRVDPALFRSEPDEYRLHYMGDTKMDHPDDYDTKFPLAALYVPKEVNALDD